MSADPRVSPDPATTRWVPLWPLGVQSIPASEKAQPSGVATLGADGIVPASQLPPLAPGGMTLISDTTLGANAASIDLTSIPQTYRDLLIQGWFRSTSSGALAGVVWTSVNGDKATASYTPAPTQPQGYRMLDGASPLQPANSFSFAQILLPDYRQTTKHKTITAPVVGPNGGAIGGVTWLNTAAINRVTFSEIGGTNPGFAAGCRVVVYGVT